MRIERIEIRHVAMPLVYPFRTSFGDETVVHSVLVKLTGGGAVAWGESSPFEAPNYGSEWAGGAFLVLREWLAPAILGQEISSGAELQARLAPFRGNEFAKAALDTAWWALEGRLMGRPLHELLGGDRDRIEVGEALGAMESVDELVAAVGRAVDRGYRRVKLKFRPGWELDMLVAVRSAFPDLTLHIDCNSAYRLADAELFRRVDRFALAMIEQPLAHDDLIDHAKLQARIETPICLDESVRTTRHAEQAAELGSCRFVNIKPGRVGGLTNAVAIHDTCRDAGIACWVGGMLESGIGEAICVALGTLDNFTYQSDIFPAERFYADDLAAPAVRFERGDGVHALPGLEPGIAQEPRPERLAELTVRRAVLEA